MNEAAARSAQAGTKEAPRLPRYTSYPTAPLFSPAFGPADYADCLAAIPQGSAVSLYLHVPFCDALCLYCGCHTSVVRDAAPRARYARALIREAEMIAAALPAGCSVTHIHWGGGTPTALGGDWLTAIDDVLRAQFAIAPDAEKAVEVDPRFLGEAEIAALRAIGITRASIGVQDFDLDVQRAIGRMQGIAETARAVAALRGAGAASLNIDLVYGLAHQTLESLARTIAAVVALAPDRIAVFGYAHVPHLKPHQRLIPAHALPDEAARERLRDHADALLAAAGFVRIGLDHYARPTDELARAGAALRLRRNFQGYTTDTAAITIGLGASAIGAIGNSAATGACHTQNATRPPAYLAAIEAGRFATARGLRLTPEDVRRGAVIEQLMCHLAADIPADLLEPALPALADFAAKGLVHRTGQRVSVTESGRASLRAVAALFDAYFTPAHRND